jgi:hypothetical protein
MNKKIFYSFDGMTGDYHYDDDGITFWAQKIKCLKESKNGFAIHYMINKNSVDEYIKNEKGNYFISWNGETQYYNLYILDKKTAVQFKLCYELTDGTFFNS